MKVAFVALALLVTPIFTPQQPADEAEAAPLQTCRNARITGANRNAPYFNRYTADGTPVRNGEAIAAASYDVPMGSYVTVDGLGTYRVADRGTGLAPTHIDVYVPSDADAFAITSVREVCWGAP